MLIHRNTVIVNFSYIEIDVSTIVTLQSAPEAVKMHFSKSIFFCKYSSIKDGYQLVHTRATKFAKFYCLIVLGFNIPFSKGMCAFYGFMQVLSLQEHLLAL